MHREDAEQRALIQWSDVAPMPPHLGLGAGAKIGDYLFAIPNGGKRNHLEAARLQGFGVRAGVSDLFFSFPSPMAHMHGLYIEMKAPKPYGKAPTKQQTIFTQRMIDVGYRTVVCYGWDAARLAIIKYLGADL